jgi:glycosyltransferase involved in cell wall biosynthesis
LNQPPAPAACVVLPTYNEATNLERMVGALLALSPAIAVLVVDDESPDGTGELAARLASVQDRLRVLRRRSVRGLGGALTAGLKEARRLGFERVATMDCDFSHDPAALPALIASLESADLVIGSRYVRGGRIVNWTAGRRLLSLTANRFVRVLFRLPVRDCTSNFRAYRGHVLDRVPWEGIYSSGYAFLVELLVWALQAEGTRLAEVPIEFHERAGGRSKLGLREAFHGLRHLPRLRRDIGRLRAAGVRQAT